MKKYLAVRYHIKEDGVFVSHYRVKMLDAMIKYDEVRKPGSRLEKVSYVLAKDGIGWVAGKVELLSRD